MKPKDLGAYAPEFYAIHSAIRKDMERFAKFDGRWEGMDGVTFGRLKEYFLFHADNLDAHHHAEDDHFFPVMRRKAEDCASEIDECEHEHEVLVAALTRTVEAFKNGERGKIGSLLGEYRELAEAHLAHEEEMFCHVSEEFPKREFAVTADRYAKNQAREQGISKVMAMIAWMVDAMDGETEKEFFARVPFVIPLLLKTRFRGQFKKKVAVFGE